MDEKLETGWLFAFYGPLLTERQQKLIALYCEEEGGASYLLIREPSGEGLLPRLSSPLRLLEEFSRPLTGSTHLAYIKERARPVLSEGAIERIAALSDTEEARIHEALL